MTRHPTKPDLWAYASRVDGLVDFSHGNGLPVSGMEAAIMSHPGVRAAIVGGKGRTRPSMILDIRKDQLPTGVEKQDKDLIEHIWPVFNEVNEKCVETVRLTKELTTLVAPNKPIVWTANGSVIRKATIGLYENEVNGAYRHSGQA